MTKTHLRHTGLAPVSVMACATSASSSVSRAGPAGPREYAQLRLLLRGKLRAFGTMYAGKLPRAPLLASLARTFEDPPSWTARVGVVPACIPLRW